MSRSHKKRPFRGITTTESEKQDKRFYNRRHRRACEQAVQTGSPEEALPLLRQHSDPWAMGKDGKIRFDPAKYPELMRR